MQRPAPRAVLFDLDGTLIDSLPDIAGALNRTLARHGRRMLAEDEVRPMVGDGARVLVERGFRATGAPLDGSDAARVLADFLEGYETAEIRPEQLYPHARETLTKLRSAGLKLGLCTNKPTAATLPILAALELADLFDGIVCGDTLPVRKPDPLPLLHLLHAFGMRPIESWMVGDGVNDVAAGRNAGTGTIVVSYGYARDPAALGADRLIDGLDALPALVSSFRNSSRISE